MLIYNNGGVAGNVPRNLLLSLFIHKASKATDVDILTGSHGRFYNIKKGFNRMRYISFVYSGLFSDLCDNVCFGHVDNV